MQDLDETTERKKMFLLEQELEDQKEVNKQLKAYVGDVLINIIVQNPDILEKKSKQWIIEIKIEHWTNYLTLLMGELLKHKIKMEWNSVVLHFKTCVSHIHIIQQLYDSTLS